MENVNSSNKKSIFFVTFSVYITQAVNVVTGLVSARFLGPEQLGIWTTFKTYRSWFNYGTIGTSDAMLKEVSYHRGMAEEHTALLFTHSAFVFMLFNTGVVVAVVLVVIRFATLSPIETLCFYAVTGIFVLESALSFINAYSKSHNKFANLGVANIAGAIFILIDIPLILWFGLVGHIYANLLFSIFIVSLSFSLIHYKPAFRVDYGILWRLVKVGFSMSLINYAYIFFVSSDRLLVISMLESVDLGYYSLVNTVAMPLTAFIQALNSVIFIELNMQLGATGSQKVLLDYIDRFMEFQQKIIPYFLGAIILSLPIFIKLVLPQFIPGILPSQIASFGILMYASSSPYSALMIATNRMYLQIALFIAAAAASLGIGFVLIKLGMGIVGTSIAMTLAYWFYGIAMMYLCYRAVGNTLLEIVPRIYHKFLHVFILVAIILGIVKVTALGVALGLYNEDLAAWLSLGIYLGVAASIMFRPLKQMNKEYGLLRIFKNRA